MEEDMILLAQSQRTSLLIAQQAGIASCLWDFLPPKPYGVNTETPSGYFVSSEVVSQLRITECG